MNPAVLVFGDLDLPAGAADRWKRLRADPAQYKDWRGPLRRGEAPATSVAEALKEIAGFRTADWDPGRLDVTMSGDHVRARGWLEGEGLTYWGSYVLAALRAAAEAGAQGAIHVVEPTGEQAYTITLAGGGSQLAAVKDDDAIAALLASPAAKEALALVHEKYPPVDLSFIDDIRKAAFPSGRAEDAYRALVDVLAKQPPAAILRETERLAKQGQALVNMERGTTEPIRRFDAPAIPAPITKAYPTGEALLAAFREGRNNEIRGVAARVARALDPRGFAPIAAALVRDRADAALIGVAAEALVDDKSPEALPLLLDLVRSPSPGLQAAATRGAAAYALGRLAHPDTGRAVGAILTPDLVARPDGAMLGNALLDLLDAARSQPDAAALPELWSRAADPAFRGRLLRLLLASRDRAALEDGLSRAKAPDEIKAFKQALKGPLKGAKKTAAKKTAAKKTAAKKTAAKKTAKRR